MKGYINYATIVVERIVKYKLIMNTTLYENPKSIKRIINNSLYVTILISVFTAQYLVIHNPLAAIGNEIAKTAYVNAPKIENTEPLVTSQPMSLTEEKQRWETRLRMRYKNGAILTVADGVKHVRLVRYINGRPVRINVVEVNRKLNPNIEIAPQLASTTLKRRATIRTIAQKNNSIAAVNGTYFKPQTGVPLGTLMIDKKIYTGPIFNRVAMGISKDGFKMSKLGLISYVRAGSTHLKVDNINQPRMLSTYVLIYTQDWGQTSPTPPKYGINIAVDSTGKIISKSYGSTTIPAQGYVISGPKDKLQPFFDAKEIVLDVKVNPIWGEVDHIISGGPYLVKDGQVFVDAAAQKLNSVTGRNPRTAIGYTRDNEFIMITVDGREHASIGMTLGETARLMKEFGCVEAMNLDGGGSTVMYVSGKVVNKPAQAGGIPISNALTISEKIQVAAGDLPQNN